MNISDNICGLNLSVGEPSRNHLRIDAVEEGIVRTIAVVHFNQWQTIKEKVDKMFELGKSF